MPEKLQHSAERDFNPITADELQFAKAMEAYKKQGRRFPSWSEALAVLRSLGYRKVADPSELPEPSTKDARRTMKYTGPPRPKKEAG